MAEGIGWVELCVSEAKDLHPAVTAVVTDHMVELLQESLCERPLRPADLTVIANNLIKGMAPQKEGKTHED